MTGREQVVGDAEQQPSHHPATGWSYVRMLHPAVPVWVDLSKVYRTDAATVPLEHPEAGLDVESTVPGEVKMWNRTRGGGHWIGWTLFDIGDSTSSSRVSQWVLADALSPRQPGTEAPRSRDAGQRE